MRARKWGILTAVLLASIGVQSRCAHADSLVVQVCGTLPLAYKPGSTRLDTVDINGNKCMSGSGGGGGTTNITQVGGVNVPTGGGLQSGALPVDESTSSQFHTDLTAAVGTVGSTSPATTSAIGGNIITSEPTAGSNGNNVKASFDAAGKLINSPYANRENYLRCAASTTGNTATTCTGMGAQGAGVKIYLTSVQCSNSSATGIMTTLNDSASTPIPCPSNGSSNVGGSAISFPVPLVVAANTAFQFTPGSAQTTIFVSAQGYTGY